MAITSILANWFSNYDSQKSIGSKLRAKRIAPLLAMIEAVYNEYGSVNIIDLGGRENYWGILPTGFLNKHNVKVTIVNLADTEMPEDHGAFRFVAADCCNLNGFDDNSFHISHSNSVIEHVGDWGCMVRFATELTRVSHRYFVQTPNYWFPVEPHFLTPFFQWLPKPVRLWLVLNFQLGHRKKADSIDEAVRTVESVRLLNRDMVKSLFKDANVITERYFWLPKSFIAIRK